MSCARTLCARRPCSYSLLSPSSLLPPDSTAAAFYGLCTSNPLHSSHARDTPSTTHTRDNSRTPATHSNLPRQQGSRCVLLGLLARVTRDSTHPLHHPPLVHARSRAFPSTPALKPTDDARQRPTGHGILSGRMGTINRRVKWYRSVYAGLERLWDEVRPCFTSFSPPPIRPTSPPSYALRRSGLFFASKRYSHTNAPYNVFRCGLAQHSRKPAGLRMAYGGISPPATLNPIRGKPYGRNRLLTYLYIL